MEYLRSLALAWFFFACIASAQDAREIVRGSIAVDNGYTRRAQEYTMAQRSTEKVFGSDGQVKSTSSKTKDIVFIHGDRYSRLTERDGKPLSAKEEKSEREKLEKPLAERRNETEAQRNARLAQREKGRVKEREFMQEIPDAFHFELLPDASVDGRAVWTIKATPREGYKPRASRAAMLAKFRGTLWIDKADYEWVKLDVESLETVSFGFFLARLAKGARLIVEQTRLNDEWRRSEFRSATTRVSHY